MKIGILQLNLVVGDCAGNGRKIMNGYRKLCAEGAELVVATELAILGYPPKDLLTRRAKVDEQLRVFEHLCQGIGDVGLVIGLAEWNEGDGKPLFNTAVFVVNGEIVGRKVKELLPTYDVFDELRYFEPGPARPCVVPYRGKRIGIVVCEDSWRRKSGKKHGHNLYATDPVDDMVLANPDMLVVVNASPYYWGKGAVRFSLVADIARRLGRPVVYVNQVGGNDELIFDGRSFGVRADGLCCFDTARPFREDELVFNTESQVPMFYPFDDGDENEGDLYEALVLGVRDYARKTGFTKALLGLSGGIDSALTLRIAVDAFGAGNVLAVGMPSPFSSKGSVDDSREMCVNLGVQFLVVPIGGAYDSFGQVLEPVIGWHPAEAFGNDVTEENVQARIRGAILMAISNRTGALVLATGNKSEIAVGYCTLYGDMVGGLGVISDIPKTVVYRLSHYVNMKDGRDTIPTVILYKAPSAELRPGQVDQDSLPPYKVLDRILHLHVEEEMDLEAIVAQGISRADAERVIGMITRAEHKRKQAAPGLKVTTKAFGFGRQMPIAMLPASA